MNLGFLHPAVAAPGRDSLRQRKAIRTTNGEGFIEVEGCRASVSRPYIIVLLVAALGKSGKAERW